MAKYPRPSVFKYCIQLRLIALDLQFTKMETNIVKKKKQYGGLNLRASWWPGFVLENSLKPWMYPKSTATLSLKLMNFTWILDIFRNIPRYRRPKSRIIIQMRRLGVCLELASRNADIPFGSFNPHYILLYYISYPFIYYLSSIPAMFFVKCRYFDGQMSQMPLVPAWILWQIASKEAGNCDLWKGIESEFPKMADRIMIGIGIRFTPSLRCGRVQQWSPSAAVFGEVNETWIKHVSQGRRMSDYIR